MLFKLDENLPVDLLENLRRASHAGATCAEEGIAGTGDAAIAAHAKAENRLLLTLDLDFSDIRKHPPGTHPGIVILRLRRQDISAVQTALDMLLKNIPDQDLQGNLVIVEESRVRIRRP